MFTNNGSTLQTDITTFGVNMKLAHLGRQALMGVMAVALVAGMSVKMKVCLIKSKSAVRYW